MENDHEAAGNYVVCFRCAEPNPEGTSRCQKCGAPLDDSASTHPWEMKTANHHAYADAANPRTKPIIFWGVWLYFGPSAIGMTFILWDLWQSYYEYGRFFAFTFETFMGIALPLGYGILSLWALWSVTKGYLFRRR